MLYIDKGVRASLEDGRTPGSGAELSYLIARLCDAFLMRVGLSNNNVIQAIGALESVKLELFRRIAAPNNDQKSRENGEVFVANSRPM